MKKIIKACVYSFAALLIGGCNFNPSPGTGDKVGQIITVHHGGIMYETYEAEILRGGLSNGSGVNGQAFWFTIEDPELAGKAFEYMTKQTEVHLHYRSECFSSWCRSSSGGDFAISITPTK